MRLPAADRNAGPITDLVAEHGPARGLALELASGAGQHVCHLARRLPDLSWQPSEIAADRRQSIDAHAAHEGLTNIRRAVHLNATVPGWAREHRNQDLIVLVNLLHLVSRQEADILIEEVGRALAPGGTFVLYGPFRRNGILTSPGDERFDADLRATDPEIGYKDDHDVTDMLHANWLNLDHVIEMPANNLAFIARRAR